jgi:hypothetical protein
MFALFLVDMDFMRHTKTSTCYQLDPNIFHYLNPQFINLKWDLKQLRIESGEGMYYDYEFLMLSIKMARVNQHLPMH